MARITWAWTNNDLDFSGSRLNLKTGSAAIAQHQESRLDMFQGEWFLGLRSVGFPYDLSTLVRAPNIPALESAFRAHILATPGTTGLESFQLSWNQEDRELRRLRLDYVYTSVEGQFAVGRVLDAVGFDVVHTPQP